MPDLLDSQCLLTRRSLVAAALLTTQVPPVWAAAGPILSVTDFGAKGLGDGHDDTQAIQAAIDSVAARGGGTVRFDAPRRYYALGDSLIMRPGVSLVGDGSYPTLRSTRSDRQLLFPGNFHPAFLEKLRYDSLAPYSSGTKVVRLVNRSDAMRYRVGDQVVVADRRLGRTGTFGLAKHSWLNVVTAIWGDTISLSQPIDVSVPAQMTRLADGEGRRGIPLFFYSDAEISGLSFETLYHFTMDSAALNVRFLNNKVRSKSGLYGNAFQNVEWARNNFDFTHMLGETSQNSFGCIIRDNTFRYVGGHRKTYDKTQYFGMYFQEYARNMRAVRNRFILDDFNSQNFCVSIALAQNVIVDGLAVTGDAVPELIYMGAPSDPDFPVTGNFVKNCIFDTGQSDRFVMINGHDSQVMRDNGIIGCKFLGTTTAKDAIRIFRLAGNFQFKGNRWNGSGGCMTMGKSRTIDALDNTSETFAKAVCQAIN